MERFVELDPNLWGYQAAKIEPLQIVERLVHEVHKGISDYSIIAIDMDPCRSKDGYKRVYAELSVCPELYDQFFNGNSGYRAQYCMGEAVGERFNDHIVKVIAPILIESHQLYTKDVSRDFCERSLLGPHTKLWFSKEITSPDYESHLCLLPESIRVPKWVAHWQNRCEPRKGLLAPRPEELIILLNGTFIHSDSFQLWNQKPARSNEITETGWT